MSEMVRKLARILAATYHGHPCDDDYVFGAATGGSVFVDQAYMALRAMREPTEEMFRKAESAGVAFATQQRVWPAMIDAALGEEPKA